MSNAEKESKYKTLTDIFMFLFNSVQYCTLSRTIPFHHLLFIGSDRYC